MTAQLKILTVVSSKYVLLHQEARSSGGGVCPVRIGEHIVLHERGYRVADVIMDAKSAPDTPSDVYVIVGPDSLTETAIGEMRSAT